MSWTAQQKIIAGFWLLTLVPIVLGILTTRNARDLVLAVDHVANKNEILKTLEKLQSELNDVEVAQREYILIGGDAALQRIVKIRSAIAQDRKVLGNLGSDQRWLSLLDEAIPQKFQEIQKTVNLRDQKGPEAATSQALLTDRGHQAMDDIRRIVQNMSAEENRRLSDRSAEQRRRLNRTLELITAVLLLNIFLIWLLYFAQRRESVRVGQLNEDLERRVAIRTEALQRSNEDLQQFAYVASHDLREPLRMISSYSLLLQRRYAGRLDDDADTFINFVVDGARRMSTLIQDLLEYSRAGGANDDTLAPVDVPSVLKNVTSNLKVTIAESGANVTLENIPPTVLYDEMRLTQIFQNLLSNAIKYGGGNRPAVRIRAERNPEETVFSVSDNGIGIAPEHIDKIFGIFQRLHGKEYEGTGIGLAMVKKIVERYGGRIWVESNPGVGSVFYFTVPHTAPANIAEASATTTT